MIHRRRLYHTYGIYTIRITRSFTHDGPLTNPSQDRQLFGMAWVKKFREQYQLDTYVYACEMIIRLGTRPLFCLPRFGSTFRRLEGPIYSIYLPVLGFSIAT